VSEVGPLTCAGCGLLCDDVTLWREADAVHLEPSCQLGEEWFSARMLRPADTPAATINGQPVELDAAVTRSAELLRGARRPIVRGFDGATVEDARVAVALADRLGALVSTEATAVSLRGASTATLGEVRDRSRLVVIWREDPEATHPRLLERLGFENDASDRSLIVLDDRDTSTIERADVRLAWPRERDLEALVTLHVLARELPAPAGDLDSQLHDLIDRLGAVPHATFVYGAGVTGGAGGRRRALALHGLVRSLCHERHVVTLELPRAPGTKSADDVLAWQSGYGGRVDFAGGHPELVTAAEALDDIDVTLLVEPGPDGTMVAGPHDEVWIRTAAAGVEASGTAHRLDGVPLTLQAPLRSGAPTAAAVLTRLLDEVRR
jgi:formylmethanofuran dehydrogenase subunit B